MCIYLFWFRLVCGVPMSQSAVVSLAPRVQLPIGGDGSTVTSATGYLPHMLTLETLHHLGVVIAPEVSEIKANFIEIK